MCVRACVCVCVRAQQLPLTSARQSASRVCSVYSAAAVNYVRCFKLNHEYCRINNREGRAASGCAASTARDKERMRTREASFQSSVLGTQHLQRRRAGYTASRAHVRRVYRAGAQGIQGANVDGGMGRACARGVGGSAGAHKPG